VSAICVNAQDLQWRVRYRPLATISTGYDSSASALIARTAGCDEAVTFDWARGDRLGTEKDSGVARASTGGQGLLHRVQRRQCLGSKLQEGRPQHRERRSERIDVHGVPAAGRVWYVDRESLFFHWSVEKLTPRYALDTQGISP
jgi:hypothetical protein